VPLSDEELERYARHIVLREVGGAGQAALRAARVLVVGAGGLGSPALLYLAAAGIGTLGIVDDDSVALSNLQRQIAFSTRDVGRPKTAGAAQAIGALNPGVKVETHTVRLIPANALSLIRGYDIVADGSDNAVTRFLVNDACFFARKTLVSAAVGEFEGQLATFKAHARRGVWPCYRCLYPAPPPGGVRGCAEDGVLGAVTGVMGTLQAVEILKEITGAGESLAGSLLLYEALTARLRKVTLAPDPACALCGAHAAITGLDG
jgi:adenylyltransferase/sulfurtransferase